MDAWRRVFRKGLVPLLSTHQLEVLRDAIERDDPRLLQGATTTPPPLMCVQDWPVEAACLTCYPFAFEDPEDEQTVGDTEEWFARKCFEIDEAIGEPAGCRHLLNYWDETPRDEARAAILAEINLALRQRED